MAHFKKSKRPIGARPTGCSSKSWERSGNDLHKNACTQPPVSVACRGGQGSGMSSNPIASAILLHRRARLLAGFVVSGGWGRALHRARRFRIASDRVRIWGNFRARSSVFNGCVLVGGKVLFSCALFADLTGSVHNFHNPYVNSPRYQHTRVPHLLSFCLRKQSIQYT